GDARARHRLGARAAGPRLHGIVPGRGRVLHLGPDEVVARVRHRAIGGPVGGTAHRAAGHLAALHHLDLDRVPDLGAGRPIEPGPVFAGIHIVRALVHGPWRRDLPRLAVNASGRRQWKLVLLRTDLNDRSPK